MDTVSERLTWPVPGRLPAETFADLSDVAAALGRTGYLADEALATVTFLAIRLGRPILLEGSPARARPPSPRRSRRRSTPS